MNVKYVHLTARRLLSGMAVAALVVAVAPMARADSYGFSFDGGGLSGSGIIEVSSTPVPGVPGGYQVTGISGTFSDSSAGISNAAIMGLVTTGLPTGINPDGTFVPPGTYTITGAAEGLSYDNLFYPAGNSPIVCPPETVGGPPGYPFDGGVLDIYGLLFNVQGGYVADLWSNGVFPGVGLTYGAGDALNGVELNYFGAPGSGQDVHLATTPEPESLLLLGTGLVGLVGIVRRRKV